MLPLRNNMSELSMNIPESPAMVFSPQYQSSGSSTYIHTQDSASNIWVITHNLNKYPSVTIVDSAGSVVIGEVVYNDSNKVTVSFIGAFSGKAYLN